MATALVTANSTDVGLTNPFTQAITTSGSQRLLVVSTWTMTSLRTFSTKTYNGVDMTEAGSPHVKFRTFYIKDANMGANGTHNLVLETSVGDAMKVSWALFTGVDQTTPLGTMQSWDNGSNLAEFNTWPPANTTVAATGSVMTNLQGASPVVDHYGTYAGPQIYNSAEGWSTGMQIDYSAGGATSQYFHNWEMTAAVSHPWYCRQIPIQPSAAAAIPHVEVILVNNVGTALPSLTALKWAWFDSATPNLFGAPTCQGTAETTDGAGLLRIDLTTSLGAGAVGWLEITDSDGNPATTHRCFSGPLAVILS